MCDALSQDIDSVRWCIINKYAKPKIYEYKHAKSKIYEYKHVQLPQRHIYIHTQWDSIELKQ